MKVEVWIDVPDFERFYMVSDLGRVKSVERTISYSDGRTRVFPERILQPRTDRYGYLVVSLYKNGCRWKGTTHTLVLNAFVGPPKGGEVGRHFPDRNPSNNVLTNLQWGTKQQNQIDRKFHGTGNQGVRNAHSKLTEEDVHNIRQAAGRLSDIGQRFGVTESTISLIRRRKIWK